MFSSGRVAHDQFAIEKNVDLSPAIRHAETIHSPTGGRCGSKNIYLREISNPQK